MKPKRARTTSKSGTPIIQTKISPPPDFGADDAVLREQHRLIRTFLEVDRRVSRHSPVIKGTQVTVSHVISMLTDGVSKQRISELYQITQEAIAACEACTLSEMDELEN